MLRLEVLDFVGATRWRWRLTDDQGAFLADHEVELNGREWQHDAFTDLHHYLRANVALDRRLAHEAELLNDVGDWITDRVLGPIAPALARARRPVRVTIPDEAAVLAYRPWELARVAGRSLVSYRACFVIDQGQPTVHKADVGKQLRMLAVFSLPTGAGALNLRKERFALARMVHEIAAVHAKGIQLRVLQYGATRQRVEHALLAAEGWDVVHLSGHGLPAGLMLEDDAGRPDLITSTELVDLLDLASERIKLVTLSACESAAVTAAEHLQLLGMAPAERIAVGDVGSLPAVASEVVRRLDCAVLAMRYPVVDDFAIALAESFYDLVLGNGHPVAAALPLSLARVGNVRTTPLSIATPTVFGSRALDLRLVPPPGQSVVIDAENQRLAEFPPQPERFVGRVGPMTRATTVLAERSGRPAVVFHGMAGAGKTACAVELAYTHQESFPAMAWYAAPPEGHDITTALTDCALALERQLPGLKLAHRTTDAASWCGVLPGLTEALERNRVLIVLDNIESLLTTAGAWRDERWAELAHALTNHTGLSRVIMTSRCRPLGLPDTVLVEPVHALSLAEAVLLAREWPHLRALIDAADDLAVRTLTLVQGHPKLIELAEGVAADREELRTRLAEADEVWRERGTRLEPFLTGQDPAATDADFLSVLSGWTRGTVRALPPDAATLFKLLCCMEPSDRQAVFVGPTWGPIWSDLGGSGTAPDLNVTMLPLVESGLVAVDADGYRIHPGVADTGRILAGVDFAATVDEIVGAAWADAIKYGKDREETEATGRWIPQAALSAVPYLVRQHRWARLNYVADQVLVRDESVANAAVLVPVLAAAEEAVRGTELELETGVIHATALAIIDPRLSESRLHHLLRVAVARADFRAASAIVGNLFDLAIGRGALDEALELAGDKLSYTARAGLGPWTQLSDKSRRLQVLHLQGHYSQVVDAVEGMRAKMAELPDESAQKENAIPWNVRETVLNLGVLGALELKLWQQALDLNDAILQLKRNRGAPAVEQAETAFNASNALLGLGRYDDALAVIHQCRRVFEAAGNLLSLVRVLAGLAVVERRLNHPDRAVAVGADALRIGYLVPEPSTIASAHSIFGRNLLFAHADSRQAAAHLLAAAMIEYQTGGGRLSRYVRYLSAVLDVGDSRSFDEICSIVDAVDGGHFADLFAQLPSKAADGPAALAAVVDMAHQERADVIKRRIAGWEQGISALLLVQKDPENRVFDGFLAQLAEHSGLRDIVDVFRRIGAGERGPQLAEGLDVVEKAVVQHALDALDGKVHVDPDAWRRMLPPQ